MGAFTSQVNALKSADGSVIISAGRWPLAAGAGAGAGFGAGDRDNRRSKAHAAGHRESKND
ncbi:MAG TPA: hypothetical protein VK586_13485, partial [Streptosporangiaceae bacterium]|nr:hypothetical protein [Streptosporangiaceae bacterium]